MSVRWKWTVSLEQAKQKLAALRDDKTVDPLEKGICEVVLATLDTQAAELARLREAERWVPVTERLPDDLELVEVKGTSDNPHRHGRDMCWLVNGVWTSWFVKDITHWRPLTAGPEEEA